VKRIHCLELFNYSWAFFLIFNSWWVTPSGTLPQLILPPFVGIVLQLFKLLEAKQDRFMGVNVAGNLALDLTLITTNSEPSLQIRA
jgi:hypothetical protein